MPQKFIEKMGADEVAALAEKVQSQEDIINDIPADEGEIGASHMLQDVGKIKQQIARGRRTLDRDAQLVPQTAAQKDAIAKEIRRLEELVVPEMPTKNEMSAQLGTEECELAVRKNRAFQQKWTPTLLRLKDLKRRLEPDDPFAGYLERIRPK